MTEENGSPRWRWEHEQTMVTLRADHESAYRELRTHVADATRNFERIDADLRRLLAIPDRVVDLTASITGLSVRLEEFSRTSSTNKRSDISLGLQFASFFIAALAIASSLIFAFVRSGGVH